MVKEKLISIGNNKLSLGESRTMCTQCRYMKFTLYTKGIIFRKKLGVHCLTDGCPEDKRVKVRISEFLKEKGLK